MDFLINREQKADYEDEIEKLGGRIYHMCPLYPGKFHRYKKEFRNFLEEHPGYDVIHSNLEERSYFAFKIAKKMGIPKEKLVVVSIMPCLAKKYECARDEFKVNGIPDVDYSISTRELARLIKRANIGFPLVLDSPFDNPMGESTGAGVIFGTTGGVMEAALRSVYEIYTGESLKNVNFEQVRGLSGVRRATINLNGFELKIGIAHGLGNARHLLEDIRNGHNEYLSLIHI